MASSQSVEKAEQLSLCLYAANLLRMPTEIERLVVETLKSLAERDRLDVHVRAYGSLGLVRKLWATLSKS